MNRSDPWKFAEEELRGLRAGLDTYEQTCRVALLGEKIAELEAKGVTKRAEEQSRKAELENERAALMDLERRRREAGGQQIEDLQTEKTRMETARDGRLLKRGQAQEACRKLEWRFPATPGEFSELSNAAQREVDAWPEWQEKSREDHAALSAQLAGIQKDFSETKEEVEALRRQPSNVPARALRVRAQIAAYLGLAETAIPFAAELIEVLPREEKWRGAIERVLRGFALSLMVDDRYYPAVSDFVNRAPLGDRLLYNRVGREPAPVTTRIQANSLFRKLQIKEGPFSAYLESALKQRFDYVCVDSMQAFRSAEMAVTRQG